MGAVAMQSLGGGAEDQRVVIDSQGRRLALRRMGALERLRLFKAAGPELSHNEPWLGMAILASSVTAIDDVPVPMPTSETHVENLVARLGDAGIAAVAAALETMRPPRQQEIVANAGN